jgi:hypothetical protein
MTTPSRDWLPGVHPSLNIQGDPETYEIENRAVDPEGRIEAAMRVIADWAGRDSDSLRPVDSIQGSRARGSCSAPG